MKRVQTAAGMALLLLAGCGGPPPRAEQPNPANDTAYTETVEQLAALNRQAEDLFQRGQKEEAAAALTRGLALQERLLKVVKPTMPAMEAASDLDDLYARMLISNGHHGWARMTYQKNVARWRMWKPQTPETERRLRQAQDGITECDRLLR